MFKKSCKINSGQSIDSFFFFLKRHIDFFLRHVYSLHHGGFASGLEYVTYLQRNQIIDHACKPHCL